MPKIYADIPKFKRIEAALRKTTVSCADAIGEIDSALAVRRTEKEKALLNKIRSECVDLLKDARTVVADLVDGAE